MPSLYLVVRTVLLQVLLIVFNNTCSSQIFALEDSSKSLNGIIEISTFTYNNDLIVSGTTLGGNNELWRISKDNFDISPFETLSGKENWTNTNKLLGQINGKIIISQREGNEWDGYDGSNMEIWATDGIKNGTNLILSLRPAKAYDKVNSNTAVIFNDKIYFTILESHEPVLWVSDGTAQGTRQLEEYIPAITGKFASPITVYNDVFLFSLYDKTTGLSLWQSDGTWKNTFKIMNIQSHASQQMINITKVGDLLFFESRDMSNTGTYLNCINLTNRTQTKFEQKLHRQNQKIVVHNETYFYGIVDWAGSTAALHKSDGTKSGTSVVQEFKPPDGNNPKIDLITTMGDWLYFAVSSSQYGYELWRTQGTTETTHIVADISEGIDDGYVENGLVHEGQMYFSGKTEESGVEIWITDGTTSGTRMYQDFVSGARGFIPSYMSVFNDHVIFQSHHFIPPYDGKVFAFPVEPQPIKLPPKVTFHPNPADDKITIDLISNSCPNQCDISITILNSQGQPVETDVIDSFDPYIDISHLVSGLYFIKINDEVVKKLMKY